MTDKSYVTMEQRQCVVCAAKYDTGSILLDRRLRESFEPKTVVGPGLCPECTEKESEGYIALIEIDAAKSDAVRGSGTIKAEDAYRTGRMLRIRRNIFEHFFGEERFPPAGTPQMAFIDQATVEYIVQWHTAQKERHDRENAS